MCLSHDSYDVYAALVLGFLENSYTVLETAGAVEVEVGLNSGTLALGEDVVVSDVEIESIPGTATGGSKNIIH